MSAGPRPFNTTLRRDPAQGADLRARIDAEIGERIAEAVDFVCLETLVSTRHARRLPPPVADSARDRADFEAGVRAFLERLHAELGATAGPESRAHMEEAAARAGADRVRQLIAAQVVLAKDLPDYWQRFDAVRPAAIAGDPAAGDEGASGGERRSVFRRLFGAR